MNQNTLNRATFKSLVRWVMKPKAIACDDSVYSDRFNLDYTYDYAHAIVQYYKAMGCTIVRTNWNILDGRFYIYFTAPTVEVDVDTFLDNYKQGTHYDTRTLCMFKFTGVLLLVFLLFVVLSWVHKGLYL